VLVKGPAPAAALRKMRITSGAAYDMPIAGGASVPVRAAHPKSITVHCCRSGNQSTLAGLRSRCTYPWLCIARMHAATCRTTCTLGSLVNACMEHARQPGAHMHGARGRRQLHDCGGVCTRTHAPRLPRGTCIAPLHTPGMCMHRMHGAAGERGRTVIACARSGCTCFANWSSGMPRSRMMHGGNALPLGSQNCPSALLTRSRTCRQRRPCWQKKDVAVAQLRCFAGACSFHSAFTLCVHTRCSHSDRCLEPPLFMHACMSTVAPASGAPQRAQADAATRYTLVEHCLLPPRCASVCLGECSCDCARIRHGVASGKEHRSTVVKNRGALCRRPATPLHACKGSSASGRELRAA
jgi:hypothetical protein